jgi:hypothetical protein
MKNIILAAAASLALAAPASAAVFTDDFESHALGLNQTNFGANWTVTGGTVDVVGPGSYSELCNAGSKCVDLDGSTSDAGVFTSAAFNLTGGVTYFASYDLAANRRTRTTDLLTVTFGSASALYTLASASEADPFTTRTLSFTPGSTGTYSLSFSAAGGDNIGPLLDNVVVSDVAPRGFGAVPEPATWGMMVIGFMGMGSVLRSRRRQLAFLA